MATGFLQVMVTTQTALPLENVKITVIDSANYSSNRGYGVIELIEEYRIPQIDTYILPVYYWRCEEMLTVILSMILL